MMFHMPAEVTVRLRTIERRITRMPANVRGIVAMLGAMLAFALGDTLMKLQSGHMPLGESLFVRGLMASAVIWGAVVYTCTVVQWAALRDRFLMVRTLADSAASFFYIAALGKVPLAEAGAIMQTNPLAVTAGAALFLGESVGWRRSLATAIGFLGVLMIIQPGSAGSSWASLLVIGAVLMSAGRDLVTRRLEAVPTLVVTAAAASATTVISLLLLPFEVWRAPVMVDVARLALAALCVLAGQVLVIISIRSGDVSAVVPFRYSSILWTMLLSVTIWGYLPNKLTLAGIVVVSVAGLYAFYREQSLRQQGRLQ